MADTSRQKTDFYSLLLYLRSFPLDIHRERNTDKPNVHDTSQLPLLCAVGNAAARAVLSSAAEYHSLTLLTPTNPLTDNDPYRGRTAPLTSKRCILYIYSTNIGTEYFKRGIYSPFFSSSKCSLFHNSNVLNSCIIHILYFIQ